MERVRATLPFAKSELDRIYLKVLGEVPYGDEFTATNLAQMIERVWDRLDALEERLRA